MKELFETIEELKILNFGNISLIESRKIGEKLIKLIYLRSKHLMTKGEIHAYISTTLIKDHKDLTFDNLSSLHGLIG